ncbi:hypothetical protein OC834_003837 [Tilletia horrida]|nr:hypothetical protein OC834_003837 [Tilletia horrida]
MKPSLATLALLLLGAGSHTSAVPIAHANEPTSSLLITRAPAAQLPIGQGPAVHLAARDVAPAHLQPLFAVPRQPSSAAVLYPADQLAARELDYAAGGGLNLPFVDRASLDEPGDFVDETAPELGPASDFALALEQRAPPTAPSSADGEAILEVRRAIEAIITEPLERAEEHADDEEAVGHGEEDEENLEKRIVYSPAITYPRRETVWRAGDKVHVDWRTADIPNAYKSHKGSIMLGYRPANGEGGLNLHRTLASRFPIMAGHVSFHLPANLPTRHDYIVVLFGDSGNASPLFTIRGRANQLVQQLDTTPAALLAHGGRPVPVPVPVPVTDQGFHHQMGDGEGFEFPTLVYKANQPAVGPGVEGESLEDIIKSSSNGLLL